MTGYDPDFLVPDPGSPPPPADAPAVPLPRADRALRELPSTHFTVLLDPVRRLAAATAVNIDGAALVDVARGDDWHLDPRVPADEQAGPELYARNDLDRGHLVRRRDPCWGPEAAQANRDTFSYANAAPQASRFNQGETLWVGLEDHVLTYADTTDQRLSVLTGPVLAADDPVYRGVGIPRLFWKVAAWAGVTAAVAGGPGARPRLRAVAFVLDQSPVLDTDELARASAQAAAVGEPPPLGPFRTFTVPVADVARLTGLDLGPLVAADVSRALVPAGLPDGDGGGIDRERWAVVRTVEDVAGAVDGRA